MAEVIKTTFKLRRGLSADWERVNPVLAEGEPGWALDTQVLKIGDGILAWNDLRALGEVFISEEQIQEAVNKYLEEHPITLTTDATLSVAGQAADAAAVRAQCLFSSDALILCAGDADDNTF